MHHMRPSDPQPLAQRGQELAYIMRITFRIGNIPSLNVKGVSVMLCRGITKEKKSHDIVRL